MPTDNGGARRPSSAAVVLHTRQRAECLLCLQAGTFAQRHHIVQFHAPLGNGPGFIEAQHIHPRERLDTIQLLHQHPVTRQPDHTDRQHRAGQQHQPFGDHADERRRRGHHRLRQGIAVDRKLLEKQQRTDRNNHNRYKADDAVERIHDRRLRTLELLGSRRNGGDIIISATCSTCARQRPLTR